MLKKNSSKIFLFIFIFISQNYFAQNILINEVMASNDITIYDEDGEASDWIELYNKSSNEVNLEGYFLSDDSLNTEKWKFENTVVQPGNYLLIFASGKDTLQNYWHTNFKISASGENIFLSDPSGNLIDRVDIPASITDVSYARKSDGLLPWIFQIPSPGFANTGNEIINYTDSVKVSIPSGFYTSSISIELSANSNNIYYTLDGSNPNTNSLKYTDPINIDKTSVLKAVSLQDQNLLSSPITQTYFINESTNLPVISLTADPFDLFSPDSGIYTNFTMDWERPAHIEFFEEDKSFGFSENCGINIHGTQSANWDQKSFAVKFKKKYGISKLVYPLFPEFPITTFNSLVLRNSGNDFQYTHLRDAMEQTLVKDLDIDYAEYRPAAAFINGQYWGIYNIREKVSKYYVANRYGINPDSIDLLENNMSVLNGDSINYKQLIDYMSTNDLSTNSAYEYLNSMIDLNECILYFAAEAYYDNLDWPGTNIKFWRKHSAKGKWRWILLDLDFGFGLYAHGAWEDHIQFMFSPVETRYSNPPWATFFQRKLIENPIIRNHFINQIADLLNTNFKSARVVNVINTLANHIAIELPKHRARWGLNGENLDKLITFAKDRPVYLRTHVRSYFKCGDDGMITINSSEGGSINLNSLNLQNKDLPFSGIYFQGNEIHLKAVPIHGYKFDGWSGDLISNEFEISLFVNRSTTLTANFSIDSSSANDIVINEINYNSSKDFDTGDWVEIYNRSNNSVNIGNWYFSDSDSNHKFIIPSEQILNSGAYLVLVENDSAFTSRFPKVKNYIGNMYFGLSGSGEFMKLVNAEGEIIDSLTYNDKSPWPTEADGNGATLELLNAASDNSIAENWKASASNGTPGTENSVITNVENNSSQKIPSEYLLYQNYPNPFNPQTVINYQLPRKAHVTLKVYDILGREVSLLVKDIKAPGVYSVIWDASKLASGIYICTIRSGDFIQTKKMVLMK
jgi:hypothetical protein